MVVDEKRECLMISGWVDVRPAKIGMGYRQSRAGGLIATRDAERARTLLTRVLPLYYGYAALSLGSYISPFPY